MSKLWLNKNERDYLGYLIRKLSEFFDIDPSFSFKLKMSVWNYGLKCMCYGSADLEGNWRRNLGLWYIDTYKHFQILCTAEICHMYLLCNYLTSQILLSVVLRIPSPVQKVAFLFVHGGGDLKAHEIVVYFSLSTTFFFLCCFSNTATF